MSSNRSGESIYTVMNPLGDHQEEPQVPLAERPSSLSGRTVYCISQIIGGADILLKKIAESLPNHVPGVKTVFVRRATTYSADEPELWAEIERNRGLVIYGCAA